MDRNDRVPSLAGLHILVAEDDTRFSAILGAVLRWRGALVTVASPAAGVRFLRAVAPSVLVIGTSPAGAAALLAAARRAFGRGPGDLVPALAVASYRGAFTPDFWMAAGFQACLTTPIEVGELCRVVSRLATPEPAGSPAERRRPPRSPLPPPPSIPWLLP